MRPELMKLVQNCSSLQKLSLVGLRLNSDDIQSICQNGQTLQVLNLSNTNFDVHPELVKYLLSNCAHLTEINISMAGSFSLQHIQAFVEHLTPTILKVGICDIRNLQDEHVTSLVKRCNNITHLELSFALNTIYSAHSIIEHLKASLEELSVFKFKAM